MDAFEGGGSEVGSKSRSGIGGEMSGLRLIRSRIKRKRALKHGEFSTKHQI